MTDDLRKGGANAAVYNFSLSDEQTLPRKSVSASLDHDLDDDFIRDLAPAVPVPVLRPERLINRTKEFVTAFTGHTMYAVKCNPDKVFLKAIHKGGVKRFDAASIAEVRLIRGLFPNAKIYFMHPIKAPEAIREAYVNHGVRAFVLDYADELDKILHATNSAPDLELFVRLAIPKDKQGGDVATDFSSKFGAKPELAAELLHLCRAHCVRLGLSFHVGTQCHDPIVYTKAIRHAKAVIDNSGVDVEVLDIGGGFPADLEGETAPPIASFTKAIADAVEETKLDYLELLCEVGRGLVACAGALIVRVEGRKDDLLYLNDGTYGGLFEGSGSVGLRYPVHLIRRDEARAASDELKPFRFAGPTCDSVDMLRGPFMLPADITVGDWIRIEQIGAYGEVSRTDFNGFGTVQKIIIQKEIAREEAKHIVNR